ncbi:MAG: type II toxin-antitoxin system VapB family antitoxin [Bradymonadales bacterium]|nr:type II toxin-antitoxin system VapB family antitoxin [Bradymonadales bacterium]
MALSIKHDEADRLARELSRLTGESLTEAVVVALRERLQRQRAERDQAPLNERAMRIGRRFCERPLLDSRTDDEILGYDKHGLPR